MTYENRSKNMKNLKEYILTENNFFKNLGIGEKVQIEKWLDEYKIKNYKINDDLTIDVNGDVDFLYLDNRDEYLPEYIQFNNVEGNFRIAGKNLKSLRGCPKDIYPGGFCCSGCPELTSLEGCPEKVKWFNCSYCKKLKSLKGCPKYSPESFDCSECESLTSLEGCPEYVDNFSCGGCKSLKSLKGCPKKCK
jgi:hypothetical protein